MNLIKKLVPKTPFILMLSGGEDSVAAAHFLHNNPKNDIVCWHFNNKFIPQDDLAEQSVRDFCDNHKYKLVVSVCQEKYKSGSIEAFARNARYNALHCGIVMGQFPIPRNGKFNVITAHHLDDCVESYLMNCFKGQSDYCPIPVTTKYSSFDLTRPFLLTKKEDFVTYIKMHGLGIYTVQDECNDNLALRRNLVRKVLLPVMTANNIHLHGIVRKMMEKFISREFDL